MSRTKQFADASTKVPVPLVRARPAEDGRMVLERPKAGPLRRPLMRLLRLPTTLRVTLDPLGSEVWRHIDGTRTVGQILVALEQDHPDEGDLPRRLGTYLSQLTATRLIELR